MAKKKAVVDLPRSSGPPADIAEAIENEEKVVPIEKMDQLKGYVREARELSLSIQSTERDLADDKTKLNKLRTQTLPDFMNDIQVPAITIAREGNMPAYEVRRVPFYSAGVPTKWEQHQKDEAFEYLKSIGHDDLIKNEVVFTFPRGVSQREIAEFVRAAKKIKVETKVRGEKKPRVLEIPPAEISRGVNGRTLTKWLKDRVEKDNVVPELSKIGGFVGAIAELNIIDD